MAISTEAVVGKPDEEVAEASLRVFEEAVGKAEETDVKEKREAGKVKGKKKIEARLESLARMYETKKARQGEEETVIEDAKAVEE